MLTVWPWPPVVVTHAAALQETGAQKPWRHQAQPIQAVTPVSARKSLSAAQATGPVNALSSLDWPAISLADVRTGESAKPVTSCGTARANARLVMMPA